jgi:hypothetical protein
MGLFEILVIYGVYTNFTVFDIVCRIMALIGAVFKVFF